MSTYTRPGKLYRRLPSVPRPLFKLTAYNMGTANDSEIRSVTITRGTTGTDVGLNPSSMELGLAKFRNIDAGADVSLTLTPAAADAIAAMLGGVTGAEIAARFTGRIGTTIIEDRGKDYVPTIVCSSWTSQLQHVPGTVDFPDYTLTADAIATLMQPTWLAPKITPTMPSPQYDRTYGAIAGASFGSTFNRLTADIGMSILDTRAGESQILTLPHRLAMAEAGLSTVYPIDRSQVDSPIQWRQPADRRAVEYEMQYTTSTGGTATIYTGEAPTGTVETKHLDWRYIRYFSDQWRWVYGLRAQGWDFKYRLDSIHIDLLRLLTSARAYDRTVAAQLLAMEVGEAVYLGGDWPGGHAGIWFATGIKETITGSEWSLQLTLAPYSDYAGTSTPIPPARTWDQATRTWSASTGTWNAPTV